MREAHASSSTSRPAAVDEQFASCVPTSPPPRKSIKPVSTRRATGLNVKALPRRPTVARGFGRDVPPQGGTSIEGLAEDDGVSLNFSHMVDIFGGLIDLHEVKLCIQLLQFLRQGPLGSELMPFGKDRLFNCFDEFVSRGEQESEGLQYLMSAKGLRRGAEARKFGYMDGGVTGTLDAQVQSNMPKAINPNKDIKNTWRGTNTHEVSSVQRSDMDDATCLPVSSVDPDGSDADDVLEAACAPRQRQSVRPKKSGSVEFGATSSRSDGNCAAPRPLPGRRSQLGAQGFLSHLGFGRKSRTGESLQLPGDSSKESAGDSNGIPSTVPKSTLPEAAEGTADKPVKKTVQIIQQSHSEEQMSDVDSEESYSDFVESKRGTYTTDINEELATTLGRPTGPWIVHPNHPARMIWDLLCCVLILCESVVIPLSTAFDIQPSEGWFHFTICFFCVDMILTAVTGFFADGMLVMQQSRIVRRYLFSFFLVDFVSTFPWELALKGGADQEGTDNVALVRAARFAKLIRITRLLRLIKLRKLLAKLEDLLPSSSLVVVLSLLKMLGFFALLCHWSACTWGFLGSPEKMGHASATEAPHDIARECSEDGPCEAGIFGSPWLRRYGLDGLSAEHRYLTALNFATGLITGGETGGINPGHWPERVYVVLMMVISFLVCATILSEIVVVIQKMNQDRIELQEQMWHMKEFMVSRKVPLTLQGKIKRYLEFQHKSKRAGFIDRHMLLDQLSPWLRLELTEHLNGEVIEHHPFFQELPPRVFKSVCGISTVVLYAPGDLVVQRGHRATCMCFIVQGKLRIVKVQRGAEALTQITSSEDAEEGDDDDGRLETEGETDVNGNGAAKPEIDDDVVLEPPSWIGDLCLFKEMVRTNTVMAVTHAELLTVGRDALINIIDEFPKMKPIYDSWRERVGALATGDGTRCEHCGKLGHSISDCPKLAEDLRLAHNLTPRRADSTRSRGSGSKRFSSNSNVRSADIGGRLSNLMRRQDSGSRVSPIKKGKSTGTRSRPTHNETHSSSLEIHLGRMSKKLFGNRRSI